MTKYAYAERVVKKVRNLLKHDKRFTNIVAGMPTVNLDQMFYLDSLVWNYYDIQIMVTKTQIVYGERSRPQAVIMQFNGFDDLLSR